MYMLQSSHLNLVFLYSLLNTFECHFQGCFQAAKAMSVPRGAILGGLLLLTSFVLSPCVVKVPGTDWVEPSLLWLTISMPTGSRKTTVYQFMRRLLQDVRRAAGCSGRYVPHIHEKSLFRAV